jgi:hypothetical protein
MNTLAVVTHSDFLRRQFFLFTEQSPTWRGGYGNPTIFTGYMKDHYQALPEDGLTIFVGHSSHSDVPVVEKQFDELRDKVEVVLNESSDRRELDKVYMVEL